MEILRQHVSNENLRIVQFNNNIIIIIIIIISIIIFIIVNIE
jgi:hypothetical protein